jgi:hypothetical protein
MILDANALNDVILPIILLKNLLVPPTVKQGTTYCVFFMKNPVFTKTPRNDETFF